jgi:hypothetical protein
MKTTGGGNRPFCFFFCFKGLMDSSENIAAKLLTQGRPVRIVHLLAAATPQHRSLTEQNNR